MKQILIIALFLAPSLAFADFQVPVPALTETTQTATTIWPTPTVIATSTATTTPWGGKTIKSVEFIPWDNRANIFFTDGTSIGLKDTDSRYSSLTGG